MKPSGGVAAILLVQAARQATTMHIAYIPTHKQHASSSFTGGPYIYMQKSTIDQRLMGDAILFKTARSAGEHLGPGSYDLPSTLTTGMV